MTALLLPSCLSRRVRLAPATQEHQRGRVSIASLLCHPLQPSPGVAFVREAPAGSAVCAGAAGEGTLLVPPGFPCQLQQRWSKDQLSSLLVALFQEVIPPELFDLLVLTLCRQAPAFATSLNYAKLVMAMLTMYQSQVSRTRLGSCRSAGELAARAAADPGPGPGVSGGLLAGQLSEHLPPLRPRSPQPTGAVWLPLWIRATWL